MAFPALSFANNCAGGYRTVCAAGCNNTSIQSEVNGIPGTPLTGNYCIDIKDNGIYLEQVTVRGKNPNNFRIYIGTDTGGATPVIKPPANSTAAFQIANASVTILNIDILPTNAIPYGVLASSDLVTISTINVNDSTNITAGGFYLTGNYPTVSYSSVTVVGSTTYGLFLFGNYGVFSYDKFKGGAAPCCMAAGIVGSSNTISQSFVSGGPAGGDGLQFMGAAQYNTVSQSTLTASFGGSVALKFNASSFNTVTQSYIYSDGHGVVFGDSNDTISLSTITNRNGINLAVDVAPGAGLSDVLSQDIISNSAGDAVLLDAGSSKLTISSSTISSGGGYGIHFQGASSITVIGSMILAPVRFDSGATLNNISQSTITISSAGVAALDLTGSSSSNTVSLSFISNPPGIGLRFFDVGFSGWNNVTGSTMIVNNAGTNAVLFEADHNTVTQSYASNISGDTVFFYNSLNNVFSYSTAISSDSVHSSVSISGSSNTITHDVLFNGTGYGLSMNLASTAWNTVSWSTITNSQGYDVFDIYQAAHDNTITQSYFSSQFDGGIVGMIEQNAYNNTISFSTLTTSGPSSRALVFRNGASSNTVTNSYMEGGADAMNLWVASGSVVTANTIVTRRIGYSGLLVTSASSNLTISSNVITGAGGGAGIYLDVNNSGFLTISSNTILGGSYGIYIATQGTGAVLSIATMTITGPLTAGATAIHFAGGTFVSTFSYVAFNDPNIAVDVNGASLGAGSRVTMLNYSGGRGGPAFENDPRSLVDWVLASSSNVPPSGPVPSQVMITSVTVIYGGVGADAYTAQASTASDFSGSISSAGSTPANPLTVTGLTPNTTYFLRVGAVWGSTTFYANTTPALEVTAAASPDPLVFSAPTLTQFTVSWSSNGNPAGTNYEADISTDIFFSNLKSSVATAALTFTFASLTGQTTYYVRVKAVNSAGVSSSYALGVVLTATGVITISANRLTNFWLNVTSALVFAQGASIYHYRVTGSPVNTATSGDPPFNGSGLTVPLTEGLNYFHVYGTDGGGGFLGAASFGPIDVDTGAPVMISVSAQNSATDSTAIPSGGTTLSTAPRFTWLAAGSLSPIVGYSVSFSTDPAAVPTTVITTTINFIDELLSRAGIYYIKVAALNLAGNLSAPVGLNFTFSTTPSVDRIVVKQNYFNPLRGQCMKLEIDIAEQGRVRAELYTLLGQKVASLADQDSAIGVYNLSWCGQNTNGRTVAVGAYLLHIEAPGQKKDFHVVVAK